MVRILTILMPSKCETILVEVNDTEEIEMMKRVSTSVCLETWSISESLAKTVEAATSSWFWVDYPYQRLRTASTEFTVVDLA